MITVDHLPIAVRAFSERAGQVPPAPRKRSALQNPRPWSLVFDCETTTDAAQQLRFGVYQVRNGLDLHEAGLFYETSRLAADELALLQRMASERGLRLIDRATFVDEVFYRYGYDRRGTVIGFNLPFDLSRLAIRDGIARRDMFGGFSFTLSEKRWRGAVRVLHLSRRQSLINFGKPPKQETPRGSRNRGVSTPAHRGFFVDVAMLASALMSEGFSLATLCERLRVETPKQKAEAHGATLNEAYATYALTDVQATWECFLALRTQYATHNLDKPLYKIFSEASLGKGYLEAMGIAPLLRAQPDLPRALLGKIMCGYFGGRAEVRWRREIKRVLHCDFKSMYPSVSALMGLWPFVIAQRLVWRDGTEEVRQFLREVTLESLRERATWTRLTAIVRVSPQDDVLPVRAPYDPKKPAHTIGLNYLTCDVDLWLPLADCLAAKILTGRAPECLEAIIFEAGPPQDGLATINLFGNPDYTIDPAKVDAFTRLVDLRDAAKERDDPNEKAIKIVVNATSYGIFVEVNRKNSSEPENIAVYGPFGGSRIVSTTAVEEPVPFFHPLLGVLITGAARLMLAITERLIDNEGLDWAFCDTDSMAIAKPDNMPEVDFLERARRVIDWFAALNPYRKPGSILQIEKANFGIGADGGLTREIAPLYCFAISAKRYALFNVDEEGRPVLRSASAHGLGQFRPPYGPDDPAPGIPAPAIPLSKIGVDLWQYDYWYKVVEAALAGRPNQVPLDYHPALQAPAVMRYGATSPALLRWFDTWNATKAYIEQVRPFGFMLSFLVKDMPTTELVNGAPRRGRPTKRPDIRPIAPFESKSEFASHAAFDRETGEPVAASSLKTYVEALQQYHLHPEDKFLGGDFLDRGRTERRHVYATRVVLIGKEANRWEELSQTGDFEGALEFGSMQRAPAAPHGNR